MAHRECKAIMGCTRKQYKKVLVRGGSVRIGLYKQPDLYPDPEIDEETFETQYQAAFSAQACVKGGGKTAKTTRDTEVGNLFDMMRYTLLSQVNKLYIGQREKLDASGFAVSKDPSPKDTPDKPTIKRIDDANYGGQHGAKIILIQKTNPLDQKKERYTYIVQISKEIDNEDSWTTVLTTMNMHKLIVQGLKRGEIVYFRVARFNARGQSHWSDPHDFIAR